MIIVKSAEVDVTRSGRVPTTFIVYIPRGFEWIEIVPVIWSTLISYVAAFKLFPKLSYPEYIQGIT